ncbi:lipopolysaccharide biogenesis outer membrane protein LptD, putative [Syntrophotalea carbinolica DSM 2380]|uniref:Lipopolysaccharide biogenesis outer membrane protein LptD, putative n=1 Tax=Syntrophotalea carbinolica (strain DSM 2380 / NBRC 103641 / GraBd1) TaxID=338963 RepID=Q3A6K9_SYNC1|nr:LPS assembly protein LptD [Syntrophotalea carbinolica]ABA87998.1 lipopolysaccharide biogenesis outer membrane protein LptD, putative [Syntrophotalea carbinolica DSM 2380]
MKNYCIVLRGWAFLLLALLMLEGGAACAEEYKDTPGAPVSLEAEELVFDQKTGEYQAQGDVLLRRGDQTLAAESMQFNQTTGDAQAVGHVRLFDPEALVTGERLRLNLNKETGSIENGRIFLPKANFHVAGNEIEKLGEDHYRIQNGTFTTCDGERPSWKFSARQLDVTVGGYAWAKHVLFHLYDVPVLYLPVMGYPVKVERESGFLMPRFGQSNKRGTELSLVYYQVLDRHMDATFYLDYFSKLGVGKGVEYRYFLGHDNDGEALLYHVSGLNGHSDQVAVNWQHMGTLPGQVWLTSKVQYVSSRNYFSDFGEVAGEYNRSRAESVVALSRHWGNNNLAGQFKYIRQLNQDDDEPSVDDDQTLQRLPEVRFNMLRQRLGYSPFYFRLDSSGTYLWQKKGAEVARLSLRPVVSTQFTPGDWLELGAEIGYRQKLYAWSGDQEYKGIPDATLRMGTRLSRVYDVAGDTVSKIQHVLQPEVIYYYVPKVNQDDLPQFESFDFVGRRNTVSYGLVNRFVAKLESPTGQADYHEFLYLRLAQEYDLSLTEHTDLLAAERPEAERWSDLRTELIFRPTRHSYFDLDTRLATSGGGLRTFLAEGGLEDGKGNAASLRYRYRRDEQEYLGAKLDLAVLKPVYLNYEQRYALDESTTLENVLNLEYRAQCWSMFLSWRDRGDEQEFTISFALTGIGKTSHFGSRLEPTM